MPCSYRVSLPYCVASGMSSKRSRLPLPKANAPKENPNSKTLEPDKVVEAKRFLFLVFCIKQASPWPPCSAPPASVGSFAEFFADIASSVLRMLVSTQRHKFVFTFSEAKFHLLRRTPCALQLG